MTWSFKDIVGQAEAARGLLLEAAAGRVPHALLLGGPSGVGQLALALAYGRYLCCARPTADDACGTCPSCRQWEHLAHPDVHFVFPIVKQGQRHLETCRDYLPAWRQFLEGGWGPYAGLDDWVQAMAPTATTAQPLIYATESDALARALALKPMSGQRRIVVMWLPERLHESAANKLLKLLEEPPSQTVFLLASEATDHILPTVRSRAQPVDLPPLTEAEVAGALCGRLGLEADTARLLARQAEGSLTRALHALHPSGDGHKTDDFECFTALMRMAWLRNVQQLKPWSEQLAAQGREAQKRFLAYAQRLVRESFVANLHLPELNYMDARETQFVARFAPFVNERNVTALTYELAEAQRHIEQNVNPRMVFFDLALKVIVLIRKQ